MFAERIGPSQLAELSAQGASLTSHLRPADLPRAAADMVPSPADAGFGLDVRVGVRAGPESFPLVEIEVHGLLPLACQRCLGLLSWPVDVDVALTAVPDEAAMHGLADPFDTVLLDADGGLRLLDAVEDEVLAALPLAPLHNDGCRAATGPTAAETAPGRNVQRPFADLGTMMTGYGSKGDQE